MTQAALDVQSLSVAFRLKGKRVRALSDVSFRLQRGEVLVVIGESGSGKSVLAHGLMGLLPMNVTVGGTVLLNGRSLLDVSEREATRIRGRYMALIPQSAATALNPVRTIGALLHDIAASRGLSRAKTRRRLKELFALFALDYEAVKRRYPHQLSGGMQQRIVNIAAMLGKPNVVIADEPTFGLDAELVAVTAERLSLLPQAGAALLVITHDLRLARRLGGRIAVVYGGYIVEMRESTAFFAGPQHPYSRALLAALPERGLQPIPGFPPELTAMPPGCPFAPRCVEKQQVCTEVVPTMYSLGNGEGRCVLFA